MKPTLIAGTKGHDTVITTSKASPACGRMSTVRTCEDMPARAELTNRLISARETGTCAETREPATSRTADAGSPRRSSAHGEAGVTRRAASARGAALRRLLLPTENPVTRLAPDGARQPAAEHGPRLFDDVAFAAVRTAHRQLHR